MKYNELSKGNYLKFNDSTIKVVRINDYINGYSIEKYEPIPLNEEWLIKFGFEKKVIKYTLTECEHYQNEFCWVYLIRGGFEVEIITGDERHNLYKVYNYVHQLQNIHFSIFGVELICA